MRDDVKDDESLREMFEQARAADAAAAPSLDAVLAGRRRLRGLVLAPVAALVLVALVVTFNQQSPPPAEISITEWRSPTAFLLEPPGDVVLYGVPSVGSSDAEVFSCDGCF